MSPGWDLSTAQVVIQAYPYVETEDDSLEAEPMEPTEVLSVRIPVGTARAFAKRTLEVVGAGRPICPLRGTPMDEDGHVCPMPDDL